MLNNIEMKKIILLVLWLPGVLFAGEKVVFGYYPDWVQWGDHALRPENIQYDKLTHMAVAFAYPDSQGDLKAHIPEYFDILPVLVDSARSHGVKVLVSLGGATLSDGFAPTCSQPDTLDKFISQLTSHIQTYQLDGVDFDWEFPSDSVEEHYYITLVKRVRQQLDQIDPTLLTTLAGAFWGDWAGKYINIKELEPYLDWFNIMTYNYAGVWSSVAGHNAPLYGAGHCIDRSVRFYRDQGVVPGKMTIGIPFYGKTFGSCTGMQAPFSGVGSLGPSPAYYEVAPLVDVGGYTRFWDDQAQCPYLSGNNEIISYDDSQSVHYKTRYAADSSLAGVMIWQLQKGYIPDSTQKGKQPLLAAITAAYNSSGIRYVNYWKNERQKEITVSFNGRHLVVFLPGKGEYVTRAHLYNLQGRKVAQYQNADKPAANSIILTDSRKDARYSGVFTLQCLTNKGEMITEKIPIFNN